ncbi:MAG TPA: isochorismatase family cysteine hydrolase [Pseudobdellovibrionaceae bacterium]|nr:isochorismatase family cysteine hydrolase [Pseudobdellovibrionaceae bacterium]
MSRRKRVEEVAKAALVILDMINLLDFPEGARLRTTAKKTARVILGLKEKMRAGNMPVIYVNDHFGLWNSDWKEVYHRCTEEGSRGREIAKILRPDKNDYFILKPKHSGFYATHFEELLRHLGVESLVLTGMAGNICVFFTAYDAHMRNYRLWIPSDGVVSNTPLDTRESLSQLKRALKVSTARSGSKTLKEIREWAAVDSR